MKRTLALLLALALAGCQSAPKTSTSTSANATTPPATPATGTPAVTAGAPQEIVELTDQRTVWECPSCGMDYDRAGECSMCKVALVETKVDYICPADNGPVAKAGQCPRCNAHVRVKKTALAAALPPATGGK